MPFSLPRLRTVLIHVAVWVAYFSYEVAFLAVMKAPVPSLRASLLIWSLNAAVLYANALWLFPKLFLRRHYLAYAIALPLLLCAFVAGRYVQVHYLLPIVDASYDAHYQSLGLFLAQSYYRGTLFIGYSLVYAYAANTIRMQKQLREQEHQLRLQERSLLEADIAFLKSQINPHFLFNALNFLYSQVYPLSEPTAKSVLLLSDIMRYALNEGGEQGKVMLEKEVQHLRNYLALNQLRFGNQLQVQLEVEGSTQFLMILPLVLITFVENCFKHGELFDAANPLLMRLTVRENELRLYTRNRKRTGPIEHSTGIGLANTRRRLEAVYAGRHTLRIADEPDTYTTHLHLAL